MAEIPNTGTPMGFATHQETSDFVALDIGNLAITTDKDSNSISGSPRVTRSFSRKGSLRAGGENRKAATATEGEATAFTISGGPHRSGEKHAVSVHVACSEDPVVFSHVTTPTSAGGAGTKYRRLGSRRSSAPWLEPRRVLFAFATLSSMGTLILLYFTLSMGKMSGGGGDADVR